MKQNIVIFLSFIVISSCSQKEDKVTKKANHISIVFENIPNVNDTLRINKNSYVTNTFPVLSYKLKGNYNNVVIENKNNFKTKITQDTIYFNFRYEFSKNETYIFTKGDSVKIGFQNNKPSIEIFNRSFKKYDYNFSLFLEKHKKPEGFYSFLQKYKRVRNKQENELYKREIKNFNEIIINKLDSIEKLGLISKHISQHRKKILFYSIQNKGKEIRSLIENNKDLHIVAYSNMLIEYVNNNITPRIIKGNDGFIFNSKEAFDFVIRTSFLKGRNKEFLLQNYLKGIGRNFSKKDFKVRYEALKNQSKNDELFESLREEFLTDYFDVNEKTKEVVLIDVNKKKIVLNDIIESLKGNIIFVDFWASWCAPCRKAMPDSRKLIDDYKDKGVVFLFISIDKNYNDWKKAQNKEKLSDYPYSKLTINYPDASFFKKIKLTDIPRYLIFNKNGELVYKNAPSPSDKRIRNILNDFLENN